MKFDFVRDLPFLRHEYRDAEWDTSSGVSPEQMQEDLKKIFENEEKKPYPIVLADAFSYVLNNGMLGINPHSMFPDKLFNGVVYEPVARASYLEKLSTEHYRDALEKRVPYVRRMRELSAATGLAIPDLDVWHAIFDWHELTENGFAGLLQRVLDKKKEKEKSGELTERQEIFYRSAEIADRAVISYLLRLSDAAGKAGMEEVSRIYAALAVRPPETLYEVLCLQHVALTAGELARERIRSLGPVDQIWTPYYVRDIRSGRLTKDGAAELFRYFILKIAAEERYANQPLCISTDWSEDSDECGLMLLFLDVYQSLKTENPKLHVRCSDRMPEAVLKKLMEMTRSGSSSIILYQDEIVMKAYEKVGVPREVSRSYLPIGCNETCIPGVEEMHICSSWINLEKAVEYTMTGGEDLLCEISLFGKTPLPATWEEFLETFYRYLHQFAVFNIDVINKQAKWSYESNPAPFLSSTFTSCVESGRDVFDCGLPLHNESVKIFALGTAVDSLLAVKKHVYENGELTLEEFADILKKNWKGAEDLRARIRKDPVKWGNGEEEADALARDIYRFMAGEIINKPTANGGVYRMGGDSVNFAERYGRNTGASPDGRLARQPLSKNIRPVNGCEHRGVSGLLKSFAALDFTDTADGAPLDLIFHPTAVEGESGLELMCSAVRLFFRNGGFCAQGNVLDAETLLKAREEPENYSDLQVRVCGWNEYFVNMHPVVQSDIIRRASGGRYE
ncbi:MAG: hypothetical protein IJR89_08490 [Clostridia bacterium]|nr:hypothetical protein [Clostridia bacterium]